MLTLFRPAGSLSRGERAIQTLSENCCRKAKGAGGESKNAMQPKPDAPDPMSGEPSTVRNSRTHSRTPRSQPRCPCPFRRFLAFDDVRITACRRIWDTLAASQRKPWSSSITFKCIYSFSIYNKIDLAAWRNKRVVVSCKPSWAGLVRAARRI